MMSVPGVRILLPITYLFVVLCGNLGETKPTVTFLENRYSWKETEGYNYANFEVTGVDSTITVRLGTTDGTATKGTDYDTDSADLLVEIKHDGYYKFYFEFIDGWDVELTEFFYIHFIPSEDFDIGEFGNSTIYIYDIDTPTVWFSGDYIFPEHSTSSKVILFSSDLPSEGTVTVKLLVKSGSALINEDVTIQKELEIELLSTKNEITFNIINDLITEKNETFSIEIQSTGYYYIGSSSTTITIQDDDPPTGSFDCRRQGQGICMHGAECSQQGRCECAALTPPRGGYKCDYLTSNVDQSPCQSNQCAPVPHSGTCLGGDSARCSCNFAFLDTATCDTPRYRMDCDANNMYVNIDPIGTFQGKIYVWNHENETSCTFKNVDDVCGLPTSFSAGKGLIIPHKGSVCGESQSMANGDDVMIMMQFYVQYMALYRTSLDEFVQAYCIISTKNKAVIEKTIKSVQSANIDNASPVGTGGGFLVSAGDEFNPLRLKVTKDNKLLTTNTHIRLGTTLKFKLTVEPEKDFENYRIESIIIDNNMNEPDMRSVTVIENSCYLDSGKFVITEPTRQPAGSLTTVLQFMVIKFSNSDHIRVRLSIKTCAKGDKSGCALISCQKRRRRRDASLFGNKTIDVLIKVWDSAERDSQLERKVHTSGTEAVVGTTKLGMDSGVFTAIVSVGGVFVIVIMVVVIVFTWRALRKQKTVDRPYTIS